MLSKYLTPALFGIAAWAFVAWVLMDVKIALAAVGTLLAGGL